MAKFLEVGQELRKSVHFSKNYGNAVLNMELPN